MVNAIRFAVQGKDKVYKGMCSAFLQIRREEGVKGFYRGLSPALYQIIPYMGIMFSTQNVLKRNLEHRNFSIFRKYGLNDLISGGFAGIISKTLVMPFDVVRKRLQVQGPTLNQYVINNIPIIPNGLNFVSTTVSIVKGEGILALYKGLIPGMTINVEFKKVRFATVSQTQLNTNQKSSDLYYVGPGDIYDSKCFASILTDCVWFLDLEFENETPDIKTNFLNILKELLGIDKDRKSKMLNINLLISRLESETLFDLQLIPKSGDKEKSIRDFSKKGVRQNTKEESEGYSKLITELFSNLPPTPEILYPKGKYFDGTDTNPFHAREKFVEERIDIVLRNITVLIGYFDLDPNRVLDVILDVFAANITEHYDFFLLLLEKSPWNSKNLDLKQKSASNVAQILGFKFSYYNSSDVTLSTPTQLYWVAALLMKHRLLSLDDLYLHLGPSDESLEEELTEFLANLKEKEKDAGNPNFVRLDGVLSDDTITEKKDEAKVEKPSPHAKKNLYNQKAGITMSLLALGLFPEARTIIMRLPDLPRIYPEIADNLARLSHEIFETIYSEIRPKLKNNEVSDASSSQPSLLDFQLSIPVFNFKKNYWKFEDKVLTGKKFYPPQSHFFFKNWRDGLPRPSTWEQTFSYIKAILGMLGFNLSRDINLLIKIIRLGRAHLELFQDEKIKNEWLILISNYILPAYSGVRENLGLGEELFKLLKIFPFQTRFALYGEWGSNDLPELQLEKVGTIRDTKYILKRIGIEKDRLKESGRLISKLVHSNPLVAFNLILTHMQSYDNQIQTVVDCLKYLSEFDFDVLSFSVLSSLSSAEKSKNKVDSSGTIFSKWLNNLSLFCGQLYKSKPMELKSLLRFIFNQLTKMEIFDLIILQNLIQDMSGLRILSGDISLQQKVCLEGGDYLREFGFLPSLDFKKQGIKQFTKCLLETEILQPLVIIMAQLRKKLVFEGNGDLKGIGWEFDHVHTTLLQFCNFISNPNHLDPSEFSKSFTSIEELCLKYKIEPEVAFFILRPKLNYLIKNFHETSSINDESMEVGELSPDSPGIQLDVHVENESSTEVWQKGLKDVINLVTKILPIEVWKSLSPHFYVTFWQLSLEDIGTNYREKYITEIDILEKKFQLLKENAKRDKKRRPKDCLWLNKLKKELVIHENHVANVLQRLQNEKDSWLTNSENCHTHFLQYCIFPRCIFSPADALYTAKFTKLLHKLGTLNFSTIFLYDKIFNQENLTATIFSCTEFEAKNYGIFLAETLKTLHEWNSNKSRYNEECNNLPGFIKKFKASKEPLENIEDDILKWNEFKKLYIKWGTMLQMAFVSSIESGEYMQIRNAFLVLNLVKDYFPSRSDHGGKIEMAVKKVEDTETRGDLKNVALLYGGILRKMKPDWEKVVPRISSINFNEYSTNSAKNQTLEAKDVIMEDFKQDSTNDSMGMEPSMSKSRITEVEKKDKVKDRSVDRKSELNKALESPGKRERNESKDRKSGRDRSEKSSKDRERDRHERESDRDKNRIDREKKREAEKRDSEKRDIEKRDNDKREIEKRHSEKRDDTNSRGGRDRDSKRDRDHNEDKYPHISVAKSSSQTSLRVSSPPGYHSSKSPQRTVSSRERELSLREKEEKEMMRRHKFAEPKIRSAIDVANKIAESNSKRELENFEKKNNLEPGEVQSDSEVKLVNPSKTGGILSRLGDRESNSSSSNSHRDDERSVSRKRDRSSEENGRPSESLIKGSSKSREDSKRRNEDEKSKKLKLDEKEKDFFNDRKSLKDRIGEVTKSFDDRRRK
ncbi:THO complex subunit 2 [Clydaea vesicula]|uniref:THO complex subunit 2 n=1 Tax=Clydaea vesicula TaxID=447962 RepID=A0AAD5TZC0_9FUNG|nr:THO complex subunit 2 [Clydaea vesicula]